MKKFIAAATLATMAILPMAVQAKGTTPTKVKKVAVAVSNPSSIIRTDVVQIDYPFDVEKIGSAVVTDGKSTIPAQVSGDVITFIAKDVPAKGCKLYWLEPGDKKVINRHAKPEAIENEFLRVKIDPRTNAISSIYAKPWKMELLPRGSQSGMVEMTVGTARETFQLETPDLIDAGPTKSTIRSQYRHGNTSIVEDVTLYDSIPRVDVVLTVDWQEPAGTTPSLRISFPVAIRDTKAWFESPSGAPSGWMDVSNNAWGMSLFSSKAFPCAVDNGAMSITLVTADKPAKPGIFEASCSLVPHTGGYDQTTMDQISSLLATPLRAAAAKKDSGE